MPSERLTAQDVLQQLRGEAERPTPTKPEGETALMHAASDGNEQKRVQAQARACSRDAHRGEPSPSPSCSSKRQRSSSADQAMAAEQSAAKRAACGNRTENAADSADKRHGHKRKQGIEDADEGQEQMQAGVQGRAAQPAQIPLPAARPYKRMRLYRKQQPVLLPWKEVRLGELPMEWSPELRTALALGEHGLLQELVPCDLVASVHFTCGAGRPQHFPPCSTVEATLVDFLKVPGCIARFVNALRGDLSRLGQAINAAARKRGKCRSIAEQQAGKQLHRQRMGTVMGPTRLLTLWKKMSRAKKSRLTRMQSLDAFPAEQETVQQSMCTAVKEHLALVEAWLKEFCSVLGCCSFGQDRPRRTRTRYSYIHKHLLRKAVLRGAIVATGASAQLHQVEKVEQAVANLGAPWIGLGTTAKELSALGPDQGNYLSGLGRVSPWEVCKRFQVSPLLLSCWCCLAHDMWAEEGLQDWAVDDFYAWLDANKVELHGAIAEHKRSFIDGGVPVSPCLRKLIAGKIPKQKAEQARPLQPSRKNEAGNSSDKREKARQQQRRPRWKASILRKASCSCLDKPCTLQGNNA